MLLQSESLDDLLFDVFTRLLRTRTRIRPSKGPAREIIGVQLRLRNPRARFSRTESRATLFSCLGELLWYLDGGDGLGLIQQYIPKYAEFSDDGKILYGAYGPRIFGDGNASPWSEVEKILSDKPDSRQAVIPIFAPRDIYTRTRDLPCTCSLQFFLRGKRLHMQTHMRSNDAYLGLPHDVFAFTMLQEIMASKLGCELGEYHHSIGSLHLYDEDRDKASQFLEEGWQSIIPMPNMTSVDPWPSIEWLLSVGEAVQLDNISTIEWGKHHHYWEDLARLLAIRKHLSEGRIKDVARIKRQMVSDVYSSFLRRRESMALGLGSQGQLDI